ncbi:hypothetical protein AJ80_08027 [Polytolypa hystricis UAMH7299]|uniref:Uncharacterized protein n=1 Tax=Polytolypa hystricis (strain UAMH7299) TaxID=1447883 RepID=A0A2B7XF37_POLH7|nr:hypothetical protein AJ80_08027 [Polytolypa hystricis UAMH7299]
MFVNLGFTADAAAAHKHEFSTPSNSPPRPSSLAGSPSRIINLALMPISKPRHVPLPIPEASKLTFSNISNTPSASSTPRSSFEVEEPEYIVSSSPLHTKDSNGGISPPGLRKVARSRTSFLLALPPPATRHKRLIARPRLLLQLQQVSQTSRPIPAVDVLPSTFFGPRLPYKLPAVFRKDRLGPNDLVVIPSDSFDPSNCAGEDDRSVSSTDDPSGHREAVATICQLQKEDSGTDIAAICLEQGSSWKGSKLPTGSYELVSTSPEGLQQRVRWVLRGRGDRRRVSGQGTSTDVQSTENKRFTFSIINPSTRRHPVIGWMSRSSIEMLDQYPSPSEPSHTRDPKSSSGASVAPSEGTSNGPRSTKSKLMEVDDHLRALIVVSGIWVAFREGWSQLPFHADTQAMPTRAVGDSSIASPQRSRASSVSKYESEPICIPEREFCRKRLTLVSDKLRRHSSIILHPSKPHASANATPAVERRRSTKSPSLSRGAAFMEKSNRRAGSTRTRRRPFSLNGPPESFVPTDIPISVDTAELDREYERATRGRSMRFPDVDQPAVDGSSGITSPEQMAGDIERTTLGESRKHSDLRDNKRKDKTWRRLGHWFDSFSKGRKER